MTVSGAPVFISLLGVSTVLAQPPDTEDPASGAAHDGHKFGAWLFPVEKLNYVLAHWVQLGGEFRSRFEGEEGIRYTTTDDNYLLTRLRFNLTIQPLKRLTFFGGMEDSRVFFNQQVPDAVPYQSAFDIRQAYVQAGSSKEGWTDIIVGRQVLVFGNERVIGPSDWINVGHTFDAVCFDVHQSGYRLSLFASSVVVGVDGSMDHLVGNNLYGVYGSLKNAVPEGKLEPYVLWRIAPSNASLPETANRGHLNETTIGLRLAGKLPAAIDYDIEVDGWADSLDANSFRAWAGYWSLGRTFRTLDSALRVFIESNYASGTKNRCRHTWGQEIDLTGQYQVDKESRWDSGARDCLAVGFSTRSLQAKIIPALCLSDIPFLERQEIPHALPQKGKLQHMKEEPHSHRITRRGMLHIGSAALAGVAASADADAQEKQTARSPDHHLPNERDPGPHNTALEAENPNSSWGPVTDRGTVSPFKYSFGLARKRITSGGWTRQVTIRELPISTTIAGVEMRLTAGGVRELHWHVEAEWALMLYGNARITAVDQDGRSLVSDVGEGDLWLFPKGVPHSIQGLGPDGCKFLLVFDDGNFNEFGTFLITDWLAHTPGEILAKNFNVAESTFNNVPKEELFIFQASLPGDLKTEQAQAARGTGVVSKRFDFRSGEMKPTKVTRGGEVKIIDSKVFPVTPISSAIVRLKPGGLRELHWHPNADEWQYYVSGKGRMTVFIGDARARTMDFEEGDVGYVMQSNPHYVENTGDTDLVFLEMFRSAHYEDISLGEWMAHTPHQLIDQHLHVGKTMIDAIPQDEMVIVPV